MTLLFMLLSLTVKAILAADNDGDRCCYFYGSVPRNESNCVIEGRQLALNFIIYNPRDEFTNLAVRWFRWPDMTRTASQSIEEITEIQDVYQFEQFNTTNLITNFTCGKVLYGDRFALLIHNFSHEKDGFYWCQVSVNDTLLQQSPSAWFYANHSSMPCEQNYHFQRSSKSKCANASNPTMYPPMVMPYQMTTTAFTFQPTHFTEPVTNESNSELIFYVVGISSALTLSLGTVTAILILISMLVRKRKSKHQQKQEESRQEGQTVTVNSLNCDTHILSASNTLSSEPAQTINLVEDVAADSVVGDNSFDDTTAKRAHTEQDHTYDTAEFRHHNHSNEYIQHNALQCENAPNVHTSSIPMFHTGNKMNISTTKNAQKCSTFSEQLREGAYATEDEHEYDDVETIRRQNKTYSNNHMNEEDKKRQRMMPQDYEPVCHRPNNKQVKEFISKCAHFDGESYGKTHAQATSIGTEVQVVMDDADESTLQHVYSEIAPTEKSVPEDTSACSVKNTNSHIKDALAMNDAHFYHCLEGRETTKIREQKSFTRYPKESASLSEKDNILPSNNWHGVETGEPIMPAREHNSADAKGQVPILISLSESILSQDEEGASNCPVLFNINQCEFDDPRYGAVLDNTSKLRDISTVIPDRVHGELHCDPLSEEKVSCAVYNVNVDADPSVGKYGGNPTSAQGFSDSLTMDYEEDDHDVVDSHRKHPENSIGNTFDDPTYG